MDPTFPPQVAVVESVAERISTPREHQLSGGTDRFYRFSLLGIMTATGIFILLFIGALAWQSAPGWKVIGHGFWSNQFWVYGQSYGVLSLVVGTVLTTLLALVLATPIAIGSALAIVFLLTTIRHGQPIKSASANFSPADKSRSSYKTSKPPCTKSA